MFGIFYRYYTIFIAMKRWDLKTALVVLPSKILLNWAYFYLFGKKFTLSEFFFNKYFPSTVNGRI